MRKFVVVFAIVVIVMAATFVPKAYAAADDIIIGHGSCDPCSIPYIMDVNPDKHPDVYIATIEIAGHPYKCEVLCGKNHVKVHRINRGVFAARLTIGKTYTIRAKARGGKWKSIEYKIRRA